MKARILENGDIEVRHDDDPKAGEVSVVEVKPLITDKQTLVGPEFVLAGDVVEARYEVEPIPPQVTVENDLNSQLDQALSNLRAYRDNAAPSNLQTVAVVKLLCRVVIALVRLTRRQLDGTE